MTEKLRLILRAFGWRGLLRRTLYVAFLKTGLLASHVPSRTSFLEVAPHRWDHQFDLEQIAAAYDSLTDPQLLRERVVAKAERLLLGQMAFYGGDWTWVGSPPRWHVNPFTSHEYPRVHWTAISDDDATNGDIKDVWEISRLPFTSTLVRAFAVTADGRYPEHWWQLVEDWAAQNPPNVGVNWRCGQETSLRAIALCFGMSAFAQHQSTTAARKDLAHRILGASAERVRPTLGYALSQRNNHAISELVFLLSIRDERQQKLLRLLNHVLDDQFYPDGSYAQQSFTYQRLAVQTLQWLLVTRSDLPARTRDRVVGALARSRDFLARCSDPVSGWLPNYGANDGSLLFDLSDAHYRDFRPLLASLGAASSSELDEPAIWLKSREVAQEPTSAAHAPTTYLTLRGPRSLLLCRVGSGKHRPAHGDQMAVDLWIDGNNVVLDPGSYRYTATDPWRNVLVGPKFHSLALEDGWAPSKVSRFLRSGMPDASLLHHYHNEELEVVIATRAAGEGRLLRALVRSGDRYAVLDTAFGVSATVRWNLQAASPVQAELSPDGHPTGPPDRMVPESGWHSPLYGRLDTCDGRLICVASSQTVVAQFHRNVDGRMGDVEFRKALAGRSPAVGRSEGSGSIMTGKSRAIWHEGLSAQLRKGR